MVIIITIWGMLVNEYILDLVVGVDDLVIGHHLSYISCISSNPHTLI